MSSTKKHMLSVFILGIILFIISGCTTQDSQQQGKVRVAFFPNITHAQALIGKSQGTFQEALGSEYEIEWKQFNAGPAEIEALFAGEVDMGYIGPGPAINGYIKSQGDLQIIAGATHAGAVFVSRKDLVIKDLQALSGKKIAVSQFGNTQDLSLRNILKENNLEDTTKGGTVEILQVQNPDIKTLLENGEIDAALVPEPWGSRLIQEVEANVILDFDEVWRGGNYSTAVIIARKDFIERYPDIVEKFLKAHIDLTDKINVNKEESKKTLNKEIELLTGKALSEDVLDLAFSRLIITNDPEKQSIIEFATLLKDAGFIKEVPDLESLFNTSILDDLLENAK